MQALNCPEMPAGTGLAQQTMVHSGVGLASAALKATATAQWDPWRPSPSDASNYPRYTVIAEG